MEDFPMSYTFDQPHPFHAISRRKPDVCSTCLRSITHPNHQTSIACAQMTDEQRQEQDARAGEELTAEIRQPLKDISRAAGNMEREAPLFFGTGDNPLLF